MKNEKTKHKETEMKSDIFKSLSKSQNKFTHGERICEIREKEKLTQAKLAEILDVDNQVVGYVERGERLLSSEKALILQQTYGYSLDWIYGISEVSKPGDEKYFMDIRELVKIKGDKICISIKSSHYDYLEKLGSLESRYAEGELSYNEFMTLVDDLDKNLQFYFTGKGAAYCCGEINTNEIVHKLKMRGSKEDINICM